jgi:hypothetical protein
MQTKKHSPEGKIHRVGPSELYAQAGDASDKLKALIPVFGEGIIKAIAEAVSSGLIRHGEMTLTHNGQHSQTLTVVFENPGGKQDLQIRLTGDWEENADTALDTPMFCPVKGIVYRKRQRSDEAEIAQEGNLIQPGSPICAISQTKSNIWYLELPADKFPKGGILTKFVISDGQEAEKGSTICYIKKVE